MTNNNIKPEKQKLTPREVQPKRVTHEDLKEHLELLRWQARLGTKDPYKQLGK